MVSRFLKLSEDMSLYDYFSNHIESKDKLTFIACSNDIINCKNISIFPDSRVESKKISEKKNNITKKLFLQRQY
jgi:hypothetical protein